MSQYRQLAAIIPP